MFPQNRGEWGNLKENEMQPGYNGHSKIDFVPLYFEDRGKLTHLYAK